MGRKFKEITLKEENIYTGKILNLKRKKVLLPDKKEAIREVVEHNPSVCAVVITKRKKIVLVGQYRKAVEEFLWEIPAGIVEDGEAPRQAVIRELGEETGICPSKVKKLMEFFPTPGFCNEKLILYMAQERKRFSQRCEFDENIQVKEFSINEALLMVKGGKIKDAKTIIGILYLNFYFTLRGRSAVSCD